MVSEPRPSDLRLPSSTDGAGVARWMAEDRERALAPRAPDVRDVPPPHPLPPPRRRRTVPPRIVDPSSPVTGEAADDEPVWRRQRREEAEFRAEFGEWRPDHAAAPGRAGSARAGRSGGFFGGVRLGAPLLVLIAVLIAVVALALHL